MEPSALAFPICSSGNTNGCAVASNIVDNVLKYQNIKIYPNPACSFINVEFPTFNNEQFKIEILNMLGEVVLAQPIMASNNNLKIDDLVNGIYYVKISSGNKIVFNSKINVVK
jgi:hypothetical protein